MKSPEPWTVGNWSALTVPNSLVLHQAAVDAQPYREVVWETKYFLRRRRLDRAAEAVGGRKGAINFAQDIRKTKKPSIRNRVVGERASPRRRQSRKSTRRLKILKAQCVRII